MKCPFCEQDIPDDSRFCTFCGKTLTEGTADTNETETTEATETENTAEEKLEGTVMEKVEITENDAMPVTDHIPEEPQKNNSGKKIVIGAVAVVAVAAVVFGATQFMGKKDGKTAVIDAFKSVTAEGQLSPMEEIFGGKALAKKLQSEPAEISGSLMVGSISDESMAVLEGGKIGLTAKQDVANKKYSMTMGLGYGDMNIANFEMYFDDKNVTVAIPEISNRAFSLDYAEDLQGQIERSPYLGQYITESGIDLNAFSDYMTYVNNISAPDSQKFDLKGLWNRYKEGSQAIEELKAAMVVENGEKKNITMDGKEQSCKGYNVTITKDAFIKFLRTSKDFFMNDETIKKDIVEYITQIMNYSYSMYGVYDMYGSDTDMDTIGEDSWKQADKMLDEFITQLESSMGDVTMNVFVDSKGRLAAVTANTTASVDGEELDIVFDAQLNGGYRLTANATASLTFSDGDNSVVLNLDKKGEYDKEKYSGSGSLTVEVDDEQMMGFDYDGLYTITDGTYNVGLDVVVMGEQLMTLSSNGVIQDLVKGKSFTMLIDSAKMYIPSEDLTVELTGDYRVMDLAGEVDMPAGEKIDILAATEDDWNTVITEAYSNIMGIAMQLYQ